MAGHRHLGGVLVACAAHPGGVSSPRAALNQCEGEEMMRKAKVNILFGIFRAEIASGARF
jgi:hypothetical protein